MTKFIKVFVFGISILYLLTCMTLYFLQDRLIFDPSTLPENYVFQSGSEVEIAVDEGISLNCLSLERPRAKGVILFLHGTRGHNARCLRQTRVMQGNGYNIFMPDYRGYGKSEGKVISEKQLLEDVQVVYDYLLTRYDESQIVVLGYSLGTGMASHLAAENNPRKLILVSPYISLADLKNRRFPFLPDFLIKYPLNNLNNLMKVNCPVTLFHGTNDEVIPFDSSERLMNIKPAKIKLVGLNGTSHRRTIFHDRLQSGISDILKDL